LRNDYLLISSQVKRFLTRFLGDCREPPAETGATIGRPPAEQVPRAESGSLFPALRRGSLGSVMKLVHSHTAARNPDAVHTSPRRRPLPCVVIVRISLARFVAPPSKSVANRQHVAHEAVLL